MSAKTDIDAARLADLIEPRGLNPTRLALEAGLGKGAVADILANPGRQVRRVTLNRLADRLGVDPEYLEGAQGVRRAASKLAQGPGWADRAGDQVVALLQVVEAELDRIAGLKVFHLPEGAPGLGVPAGATVIADTGENVISGGLVVVEGERGVAIRYLAEPYTIGTDPSGRLGHEVRAEGVDVLGRVGLVVYVP
ncbi:hypothetical protein vBDshSR4C_034 [Dinoroseobacter phage vB_DshS-R4C]|nr:hypothetical protein vBDshSR4C_034 [Dinoroseobacter phage vB_DshS-R4C]